MPPTAAVIFANANSPQSPPDCSCTLSILIWIESSGHCKRSAIISSCCDDGLQCMLSSQCTTPLLQPIVDIAAQWHLPLLRTWTIPCFLESLFHLLSDTATVECRPSTPGYFTHAHLYMYFYFRVRPDIGISYFASTRATSVATLQGQELILGGSIE